MIDDHLKLRNSQTHYSPFPLNFLYFKRITKYDITTLKFENRHEY